LKSSTRVLVFAVINAFTGDVDKYSTVIDHMSANHRLYSEWDSVRFLRWAAGIGDSTKEVVRKLFDSYRVEEQAYKGCLSLLKLADKYFPERLENACRIALIRITNPRYKNIRLILESSQDKKKDETPQSHFSSSTSNKYACVRGASYYGGYNKEIEKYASSRTCI
jgi:hypothetical protein